MSTTVFRVQNEEGLGPYHGGGYAFLIDVNHFGPHHPAPENDGINRCMDPQEYCGFRSLELLKEWFTAEELDGLKALGFNVVKIEALRVTEGRKQLIFVPLNPLTEATICENIAA